MKIGISVVLATLLMGAVGLLGGCSKPATDASAPVSGGNAAEPAAQVPAATESEAGVKEIGNTVCPVTGKAVGSMEPGAHVDYKGQRVGLCCSGCVKTFNESPDKYLAQALSNASETSGSQTER